MWRCCDWTVEVHPKFPFPGDAAVYAGSRLVLFRGESEDAYACVTQRMNDTELLVELYVAGFSHVFRRAHRVLLGHYSSQPAPAPRGGHRRRATNVYVAREAGGLFKIGSAIDPASRIATLQTASPRPIELLAAFPGTVQDERALHARFADARACGEWFNPTPELLDYVATLKPEGA